MCRLREGVGSEASGVPVVIVCSPQNLYMLLTDRKKIKKLTVQRNIRQRNAFYKFWFKVSRDFPNFLNTVLVARKLPFLAALSTGLNFVRRDSPHVEKAGGMA